MLKKQYWEGFTNIERLDAISEIQKIISNNGGCIMNFNRFSDMALSLMLEVEPDKVTTLYDALNKYMTVSGLPEGYENENTLKDITIFFNITFGHGKGYLSIEVPQVPG
jgi:hypothetical protein